MVPQTIKLDYITLYRIVLHHIISELPEISMTNIQSPGSEQTTQRERSRVRSQTGFEGQKRRSVIF